MNLTLSSNAFQCLRPGAENNGIQPDNAVVSHTIFSHPNYCPDSQSRASCRELSNLWFVLFLKRSISLSMSARTPPIPRFF
jgi:hypothetical protein